MERVALNFHWDTSLPWGSNLVVSEAVAQARLAADPEFDGSESVALPPPPPGFAETLRLLELRRTIRQFDGSHRIAIEQLGALLEATLKGVPTGSGALYRPVPSAGQIYPIRTYVLTPGVEGLPPVVFGYLPQRHELIRLFPVGDPKPWRRAFLDQPFVSHFAAAFVLVLQHPLITAKYGERGYRYGLLEAGHIAQNLQIAAGRLGLASVPVGGFVDYDLVRLLRLDGSQQLPVYAVFVGSRLTKTKRKEEPEG